jgi:hypothetical protein
MPQVLARDGAAAMRELAIEEWMGASPVYTGRIQRALGFSGGDVATIFKGLQFDVGAPHGFLDFFQLHPAFHPRGYVDLHVERGPDEVRCWIGDCEVFAEGDACSWFALSTSERHRALDAIARSANPRARTRPCEVPGARMAWSVTIDPGAAAAPEPPEVALTKLSQGASFRFVSRRPHA